MKENFEFYNEFLENPHYLGSVRIISTEKKNKM